MKHEGSHKAGTGIRKMMRREKVKRLGEVK